MLGVITADSGLTVLKQMNEVKSTPLLKKKLSSRNHHFRT